jgi:carboxylesterase type B
METTAFSFTLDLQFRGFVTGSVITESSGKELCRYLGGIPYALPPVGPFRFLNPRALPPCYRYGTRANPGVYNGKCGVCPQASTSTLDDEDCLQLNLWIPAGTAPEGGDYR